MSQRTDGKSARPASYWKRRVESAAFRDGLTKTLEAEIVALSATPVSEVVDAQEVRRVIADKELRLVNEKALADLVVHMSGLVTKRLAATDACILELVDDRTVGRINALLDEDLVLSKAMEDFVANVMEQEFIQGLFTDIIYTAIVSFNQRVNPLFGRMTMMALEDQIKGFIRFFMPMVRKQAVAFATSRGNQAVFFDFTRAIVRHLLNQPIASFLSTVSARQRKKAEALVRQAIGDDSVEALIRKAALAVWDDLYRTIKDRKLGDLLNLTANARRLAEHGAKAILPLLARPGLLRFASDEIALAAASRH